MDGPGISEKFSRNGKRGRPPLLHPSLRAMFADGRTYQSERTIQNMSYFVKAFALLEDQPWATWLIGYESKEGKPGQVRRTIVTALGRIEDPDDIIWLAQAICQARPSTRQALMQIRRFRFGLPPATGETLSHTLLTALMTYVRGHAGVTRAHIDHAILALDEWADLNLES